MKIYNIQPTENAFGAKKGMIVPKRILMKDRLRAINPLIASKQALANGIAAASMSALTLNEILRENGLTYCSADENTIHTAAGYNGGFYSVNYGVQATPEQLKAYFAQTLLDHDYLRQGGMLNYKEMINHLKRQDIIQKGLQLHTYELNTEVTEEDAKDVAYTMTKLSKKFIKPKKLFFIGNDAFYYDYIDKTAYSIPLNTSSCKSAASAFRTCQFITDSKNNTIGYTQNSYDLFQKNRVDKTYEEQQALSDVLPPVADASNNKLYAEAFRFGNTEQYNRQVDQVFPSIYDHLERKLGIDYVTKDMLQVVKLQDKNERPVFRICFYDSSIGRSLVYDEQGKYLFQMQYHKDAFGKIIACSKY